ncbi:MAG TPA: aspartate/glutamate racemase family protein [Burkholderiales bacterium]|nr:aspartate/glutamate racemase family protein [Burkholderiales bacterium]
MKGPRIALIHAVPMAIGPVAAAFETLWPEAERINLLDDSLSVDRQRAGALTPDITARIGALADYARACAADGILYTCSAFGTAIDAVARAAAIPVLKPNEAMFEEALATGRRIGMLATFPPSVAGMEAEFRAQAGTSGATIATLCVPEAMAAAQRGDMATHNALLVEAARGPQAQGFDALMLAQFSMAPASAAVQAVTRCPVLTSPASAVRRLKQALA